MILAPNILPENIQKQNLVESLRYTLYIYRENYNHKYMYLCQDLFSLKKKNQMSSAAVLVGTLRVNIF